MPLNNKISECEGEIEIIPENNNDFIKIKD